MGLEALGWTADRAAELDGVADAVAARVVAELRGQPQLSSGDAPFPAQLAGALRHRAAPGALPAIGDWVAVRPGAGGPATIAAVLPRRTALTRLGADGRVRVLAANVDLAIVVMGLDGDYNPRRLERYLAMCGAAGVAVAVALSKADLGEDVAARTAALAGRVPGPVAAFDLRHDDVAAWVAPQLPAARTAVLLGSSGAGKSTMTNRLLGGAVQRTHAVRAHDDRGQHTTTHRELFTLASGALVIDTPGLRTLALDADADAGAGDAFADVEAIAARCQFRDCRHAAEPGCEVRAAVVDGRLDAARVGNFVKLASERARGPRDGRAPRGRRR